MSSDVSQVLQQAMEFYVAGHTIEARALLLDLVRSNPALEAGWMFLSYTLEDPAQKADCLRQVLKLNPQNSEAKNTLSSLIPSPTPAPPAGTPAPTHSSPFTVDISHATDNLGALSAEAVAVNQPLKVVSPFEETPETRSPIVPPTTPTQTQKAATAAPAEGGAPAPTPPSEASPTVAKPVPQAPKPAAKPADAPKPKKRNKAGCACLGLVILLILALGAAGVFLWATGRLSGILGAGVGIATATSGPAATDTPLLLTLPPQWTDTPSRTLTPTPTDTQIPTSTPTETPTATLPEPNSTQQAELVKLQNLVENLRQLPWDGSPPVHIVSQYQAETILQTELDRSGYPATIGDQAKVLTALGFIDPAFDLARYTLTGLSDGLLGFFNPGDRTIYLIGYGSSGLDHLVFAHEFDHALVDHYFPGLENSYRGSGCLHDSQRCQAVQALVEGDATLLMAEWYNLYATAAEKKDIGQDQIPFSPQPDQNPPAYGGPLADFIYATGKNFVTALWNKGNWSEVNKAYDNLPASTEQILHQEKYLGGEQPIAMTVPDLSTALGTGWTLAGSDSLGELMTYLMLAYGSNPAWRIPQKDALTASAGWGGDHYLVYRSAVGAQTILAAEWSWDTDKDAAEFLTAFRTYQGKRFSEAQVNQNGLKCWSSSDQFSCLYAVKRNTLWIVAPTLEIVQELAKAYPGYAQP